MKLLLISITSFALGAVCFAGVTQPDRAADAEAIRAHIGSIFQAFIDGDEQKIYDTHSEDWRGLSDSGQRLTLARLIDTRNLGVGEYEVAIPAIDELNRVLDQLFPLLRAIRPADLNATLNALATALGGRGEELDAGDEVLDHGRPDAGAGR